MVLRRLTVLALIIAIFGSSQALATERKDSENYLRLESISNNSWVPLFINKGDLEMDLNKGSKVEFVVKPHDLYKSKEKTSSFKVNIFGIDEFGKREFQASDSISVKKSNAKAKAFHIKLGKIHKKHKNFEVELYNTEDSLVATYAFEIDAKHVKAAAEEAAPSLLIAECGDQEFGDCHVDYILDRMFSDKVSFGVKPDEEAVSSITKTDKGTWHVEIPVPPQQANAVTKANSDKKYLIQDELAIFDNVSINETLTVGGGVYATDLDAARVVNTDRLITNDALVNGNLLALGDVTAQRFSGDGSGLTNLSCSNCSGSGGGPLPDLSPFVKKGKDSTAKNDYAIALGQNTAATGSYSFAMGFASEAQGSGSQALGVMASAQGSNSTAVGLKANAEGHGSVAIGEETHASNSNSIAIGSNAKNDKANSLVVSFTDQEPTLFVGPINGGSNNAVGVGTDSPEAELDVVGTVNAEDFTVQGESIFDILGSVSTNVEIPKNLELENLKVSNSTSTKRFSISDTRPELKLRDIDSTNDKSMTSYMTFTSGPEGTITAPEHSLDLGIIGFLRNNDSDLTIGNIVGKTKFINNTRERSDNLDFPDATMVLTEDQKVGIGTEDPEAELDVAGTVNAEGFTIDGESILSLIKQPSVTNNVSIPKDLVVETLEVEDELRTRHLFVRGQNIRSVLATIKNDFSKRTLRINSVEGIQTDKNISNIGIGNNALASMIEGAGRRNAPGRFNLAFGENALNNATDNAESNIAIGNYSMEDAEHDLWGNIVLGNHALQSVKESSNENLIIGGSAASEVISAKNNTIIGHGAGIGVVNDDDEALSEAEENTVLGHLAMSRFHTASVNTIIGSHALINLDTGYRNTAMGFKSGSRLERGNENILIGARSGIGLREGNNNIFIGNKTSTSKVGSVSQVFNKLNIGDTIVGDLEEKKIGIGKNPKTELDVKGTISSDFVKSETVITDHIHSDRDFIEVSAELYAGQGLLTEKHVMSPVTKTDTVEPFSGNSVLVSSDLNVSGGISTNDGRATIRSSRSSPMILDFAPTDANRRVGFVYQVLRRNGTDKWYVGSHTRTDNYSIIPPGKPGMYFTQQANLGIGTSRPRAKLEVAGDVIIRGGRPSKGKVLTAKDSSGRAEWSYTTNLAQVINIHPRTTKPVGTPKQGDTYLYMADASLGKVDNLLYFCTYLNGQWVGHAGARCPQ